MGATQAGGRGVRAQGVRRHRRSAHRIAGRDRRQARALPGAWPGPAGSRPAELAAQTGTTERYVREWLSGPGGIRLRDLRCRHRALHAARRARGRASPTRTARPASSAGFQGMTAAMRATPKVIEAFRNGGGVGWHEHDPELFAGIERFFRPGYLANLVGRVDPGARRRGGEARARAPASPTSAAGTGPRPSSWGRRSRARPSSASTTTRPRSTPPTSGRGRPASETTSPSRRRTAKALSRAPATTSSPASTACTTWAIRRARRATCASRSRPTARSCWSSRSPTTSVEDNLNPIGRVFYSVSTLVCTPASLSQEVGMALGAQAGEARLTDMLRRAGFTRVRRATETPFNLVLEARP